VRDANSNAPPRDLDDGSMQSLIVNSNAPPRDFDDGSMQSLIVNSNAPPRDLDDGSMRCLIAVWWPSSAIWVMLTGAAFVPWGQAP